MCCIRPLCALAPVVVHCCIQFSIVLKSYSSPQSRSSQAQAIALTAAAPVSHRNLDLCLLAVCSCALTVLCHQAVSLSNSTSFSSATARPSATLAQVDVSVKSGWFAATKDVSDRQD
jgi:hypothetical protein